MLDGISTVWDNHQRLFDGFGTTLQLTLVAAVCALALGVVLAAFRVSPIPPLRWIGAVYVETVRNTPLTIVFFFMVFVAPQVDILVEFKTSAFVALSLYTAAFVCEAVRSGVNSVPVGQAEAARAIGMTFMQNLTLIVLPQALRTVIPPLTKNSSVAAGFFIVELFSAGRTLAIRNPSHGMWFLVGVAVLYLVITIPAGIAASRLERRVAIAR